MEINKDEYEYTYDDYVCNCESNKGLVEYSYKSRKRRFNNFQNTLNENIENLKKLKLDTPYNWFTLNYL